MKPDNSVLKRSTDANASKGEPAVRVLAEAGRAYAVYVNGGTQIELVLDLPANDYTAEWVDTKTGKVAKAERFAHQGGNKTLASPEYSEDIALRVNRSGSK